MAGDGITAGRQRSRANGSAAAGGLRVERVWTTEGVHPYDEVEWERRDVVMTNWRDGSINFEQKGVEFPAFWSVNAANIVTTKYFRGAVGTPEREWSLKQLIDRVVSTYRKAGEKHGYFATKADAELFDHELTWMLLHQPIEDRLPDPVIGREGVADPEHQALLADSVGLALLVVLESLTPTERLAFVLHDMFGLPFEQIAPIVDRTPVAAKKLASRARARVRGATPSPDPDLADQRRVVDAFLAAARDGDFDALLAILDPDVVLRLDAGAATGGLQEFRGATTIAGRAETFTRMATVATGRPALVNGLAGLVNTVAGRLFSIMSFTVTDGLITEIDILSDPDRLAHLDLTRLDA